MVRKMSDKQVVRRYRELDQRRYDSLKVYEAKPYIPLRHYDPDEIYNAYAKLTRQAIVGRTVQDLADLVSLGRHKITQWLRLSVASEVLAAKFNRKSYWVEYSVVNKAIRYFKPSTVDAAIVEAYQLEGCLPKTANALAIVHQSIDSAADGGLIDERKDDEEYFELHVLPAGLQWSMDVDKAAMKIGEIAHFLDHANINDLRKPHTAVKLQAPIARLLEQVDRIDNFHPGFREAVRSSAGE